MSEPDWKNAKIVSTMLGIEDHGIFTASLTLDYGGACQSFGGYCLEGKTAYVFIKGVLEALEIREWEKLPGTYVRVKAEHKGVQAIGHITHDTWFNPGDVFAQDDVDGA